jgi:subfamily B ATP-binding cassette protein MsbA
MLLSNPDAEDNDIIEALEAANAWKFVDKLPGKINEEVGPGGNKLSGG